MNSFIKNKKDVYDEGVDSSVAFQLGFFFIVTYPVIDSMALHIFFNMLFTQISIEVKRRQISTFKIIQKKTIGDVVNLLVAIIVFLI